MKRFSLLLCLIFCSLLLQAQELKKVRTSKKFNGFTIKENCTVLKSDEDIKQGEYKRVIERSVLTGQYSNNLRSGIWQAFDETKLVQQINFDTGEVMHYQPGKLFSKVYILSDDGKEKTETEQEPILVGGYPVVFSVVSKNLRISEDLKKAKKNSVVILSGVVTKEGRMTNRKITQPIGDSTDNLVLELFSQLPDDWLPVKVNGVCVNALVEFVIKLTFVP